jgi:hypothetical protein
MPHIDNLAQVPRMKLNLVRRTACLLASAALLASCGGGDDEAGAPAGLSITPSTITLNVGASLADPEGCGEPGAIYFASEVFIYGGAAPYRLDNTQPGTLILTDKNQNPVSQVGSPGGSFMLWAAGGGCLDPGQVVVVDATNRLVTLTVTIAQ